MANFWNTHMNSAPMEMWQSKPKGKISLFPWELQLTTKEGALSCHFMQNKENWSKWARLKRAYSTGKFSCVLEQFYLTQLNFGLHAYVCVHTQVYIVTQVPRCIKESQGY